jgi:hypothetical protein
MTRVQVVLVAVITIPLAGCVLSGKPKTVAATPAPPQRAAPAPPPEPLSIPQTQVVLPAPQPVDLKALETTTPPVEPAPPAPVRPAAPPPRPRNPPANLPRTPDPPPPAAEPEQPPRPPIQEMLSPDAQKQLRDSAHDHRDGARHLLAGAKIRTANQKRAKTEIDQFLKQSEDAENTGDMRLADQLAERAHILAKELQSGK